MDNFEYQEANQEENQETNQEVNQEANQEANQEVNQVIEQKEVLKQWFPFSRLGLFYMSILVGTNLIAMIIMTAHSFHLSLSGTIQNGSVDLAEITQAVNDMLARNMAWIMLIAYAITIPLCYLMVKAAPTYKAELKKWKLSKLLLFVMLAIGLMMLGNLVSQIMQILVGIITGHQMTNPLDSILNADNIFGSIFMVVIIAPFVEEFLFRKVLIDRVRVYGDKVTILLSGILFGLFHGNLFQVVYAMLLGMLLAYIYLKSGRIAYCIGIHMIVNIIGGALPLLLIRGIDLDAIAKMQVDKIMEVVPQMMGMGGIFFLEIGCLIATITVLVKFRKNIIFTPAAIEIPKEQQFKTIYLNTGMILFVVACVLIFITNAMA